jgi:hypothetical protein
MISPYRLGDLVHTDLDGYTKYEILTHYPHSIASKYILEKQTNINSNIDIITNIVLKHIKQVEHLIPQDIDNSTLIHLRLGDVVGGNEWHEKLKRPLEIDYLKSLVVSDSNKKYVIGKCFFAKPSSTNYEECITLSNKYLENVINHIQAEHFNSGDADIDLCCAVKAKLFIQGKGFFSKLIVDIRKKLNLPNIETNVHD